jgi:hypothetical protein
VHGHDEGVADGADRAGGFGVPQAAGGVELGVAAGVAEHREDPFGRGIKHPGDGGVGRAVRGDRVGVEPGPRDPPVAVVSTTGPRSTTVAPVGAVPRISHSDHSSSPFWAWRKISACRSGSPAKIFVQFAATWPEPMNPSAGRSGRSAT